MFRHQKAKPVIKLGLQPSQSPKTNVLDLGLFWDINCACKKIPAANFEELVAVVLEAFDKIPWRTIDKTFITLMAMLDEIIKHDGKKNFQTPHVKKDQTERVANFRIMTITALSSIGEGPRNFMVNREVPTIKNDTAALSQNAESKPATAEEESNSNRATKKPGDMTYI